MITDKQFEDAFTAAGGWFVATYYKIVADWSGERADLVDLIFADGIDKDRSGTNVRVCSLSRIIDNNRSLEALKKVATSTRILKQNPQAIKIAQQILHDRFATCL